MDFAKFRKPKLFDSVRRQQDDSVQRPAKRSERNRVSGSQPDGPRSKLRRSNLLPDNPTHPFDGDPKLGGHRDVVWLHFGNRFDDQTGGERFILIFSPRERGDDFSCQSVAPFKFDVHCRHRGGRLASIDDPADVRGRIKQLFAANCRGRCRLVPLANFGIFGATPVCKHGRISFGSGQAGRRDHRRKYCQKYGLFDLHTASLVSTM